MTTSAFDRLVALMLDREELDPLTSRYAYLSGRIDECCLEHGIADEDAALATAAVAAAIRARRALESGVAA